MVLQVPPFPRASSTPKGSDATTSATCVCFGSLAPREVQHPPKRYKPERHRKSTGYDFVDDDNVPMSVPRPAPAPVSTAVPEPASTAALAQVSTAVPDPAYTTAPAPASRHPPAV